MNKLSSTKIYETYNQIAKISEVYKKDLSKYIVPFEMYKAKVDEYIRYKYPLAKYTRDSVSAKKVIPVMFKEPYDETIQPINNTNPLYHFPVVSDVSNGKPIDIIMYCNTSNVSRYVRDNVSRAPIFYDITPRELYCYLQTGAVARGIKLKDGKITDAYQLHKQISNIYGELFAKAIDGNKRWSPTGGLSEKYSLLKFLGILFYFEQMVEKPKEKAIELALSMFQAFDKSYISSTCIYIEDDNLNICNAPIAKRIDKFTEFCEVVKRQFPELLDFSPTNLRRVYREMYGDNAIFCLEDFGSFISMLQFVHLSAGMYRDKLIMGNHVVQNHINETLKSLAAVLES